MALGQAGPPLGHAGAEAAAVSPALASAVPAAWLRPAGGKGASRGQRQHLLHLSKVGWGRASPAPLPNFVQQGAAGGSQGCTKAQRAAGSGPPLSLSWWKTTSDVPVSVCPWPGITLSACR